MLADTQERETQHDFSNWEVAEEELTIEQLMDALLSQKILPEVERIKAAFPVSYVWNAFGVPASEFETNKPLTYENIVQCWNNLERDALILGNWDAIASCTPSRNVITG